LVSNLEAVLAVDQSSATVGLLGNWQP